MREYVILCVVTAMACSGGSNAKHDSVPHDTAIAPIAPVVTATSAPEAIASRPRSTETAVAKDSKPGIAPPTGPPPDARPTTGGRGRLPALTPAGGDTLRGIVSVVGSEHDRRVMIAPLAGGRRVQITGLLSALIGHQAGTDIWVAGTTTGGSHEAVRFIVRTVEGAPAIDGTLKTEGSSLYIITADGSATRIASPPPPLVGKDGSRVWITGDPSRGVQQFGFIDPPR